MRKSAMPKISGLITRLSEETGILAVAGCLFVQKIKLFGPNYGLRGYHEMIAVEVKGSDTENTTEIIGIYRAPKEDMWLLEN
jgi:hypothetical protein